MNKIYSDARNTPLYGSVIVTLNGEDVTRDCQIADEVNGTVTLLKRNSKGECYLYENGEVATEVKSGEVVISLRDDADEHARIVYNQMRGVDA